MMITTVFEVITRCGDLGPNHPYDWLYGLTGISDNLSSPSFTLAQMQRDAPIINKAWMDPPDIENKKAKWCGYGLSLGGYGPSLVVVRSDLLGFSSTTLARTQRAQLWDGGELGK